MVSCLFLFLNKGCLAVTETMECKEILMQVEFMGNQNSKLSCSCICSPVGHMLFIIHPRIEDK